MSSAPALITITAAGADSTVERALGVAGDLVSAGLSVQIMAFDDFAHRITSAGIRFCPAPGDLAAFARCAPGSISALRYLTSAVTGMSMTLDGRLRDSTMIVMGDESPLIPSIAEARGLPIYRLPELPAEDWLAPRGLRGWVESIRVWHAVHGAVNDMRMFLGLADFSSPRAFRRSMARIPILDLSSVVSIRTAKPETTGSTVHSPMKDRQSA